MDQTSRRAIRITRRVVRSCCSLATGKLFALLKNTRSDEFLKASRLHRMENILSCNVIRIASCGFFLCNVGGSRTRASASKFPECRLRCGLHRKSKDFYEPTRLDQRTGTWHRRCGQPVLARRCVCGGRECSHFKSSPATENHQSACNQNCAAALASRRGKSRDERARFVWTRLRHVQSATARRYHRH